MFLKSLSGRFLLLTIIFVMLAEVLIFVPSVARFREDYLQARLERAQIATLALLASTNEMVDPELERELLANAGVVNVALRRDEVSELILSSPMPAPIDASYDLRTATAWVLIRDAIVCLFSPDDKIVRVLGHPVQEAGLQIEVTLHTAPMREAMLDYGYRVFLLSLVISVITAAMLFFAVRRFLVTPISRVIAHIKDYEDAPQDAAKVIEPNAGISELRDAEEALRSMQLQLIASLRQKDRLATLGGAVAKISHDLRNMLTTAQLLADRMETSQDPAVQRTAPKLLGSLSRAINLCESTLTYGKAEESHPEISEFSLHGLVQDVIEDETLALGTGEVEYVVDVPEGIRISADAEQIFRVVSNLTRNARQAILSTKKPGVIRFKAHEQADSWSLEISDTGPGLPPKALSHLFEPFEGGARQGGSGLGLAIASELVLGHRGKLELTTSDKSGTSFCMTLPKTS